jgi:hypothetical protein
MKRSLTSLRHASKQKNWTSAAKGVVWVGGDCRNSVVTHVQAPPPSL